jgi:CMP-N-acetylneuraminic acid synthetase
VVVLGIVPARGGSEAIPRKNLAQVAGRSLLAWTADAALGARRLSRVILSTDSPEIANAGRACGLDVPFLRPAALALHETPIVPVLQHVLEMLTDQPQQPDAVVLLQPTSPLRRAEHIDEAIDRLEATAADSVVSVVEVPHHYNPVSVLREERGRLVPYGDGPTVMRRQDKPRVFARNGPAVVAVRADVVRQGSLYGADSRAMLMNPEDSIDIDTQWDLDIADWLLTRRR